MTYGLGDGPGDGPGGAGGRPGEGPRVSARDVETGPAGSSFDLTVDGQPVAKIRVRTAGRHNVQNALGAAAAGLALGLQPEVVAGGLAAMATREGHWVRSRLEPHLAEPSAKRGKAKGERLAGFKKLANATDTALSDLKQWRSLRRLLERSNLPLRPGEFVWIAAGAGLLLGLMLAVTGSSPIVILLAMVLDGALPFGYA